MIIIDHMHMVCIWSYDHTHNINTGCRTGLVMVMVRRSEAAMSISMSRKVQKQLVVGGDTDSAEPAPTQTSDFYGFLWILMGFYGFLWISMGFYGFLWISMDSYRFLWVSSVPAWSLSLRSKVTLALKELWVAKQSAQQDGPLGDSGPWFGLMAEFPCGADCVHVWYTCI